MANPGLCKRTDGTKYFTIEFRYGPNRSRRKREYGGETLTEAKQLLRQRRVEVRKGSYVNPKDPEPVADIWTVRRLVEKFLREYAATKRSRYYHLQVKPIVEFFGDKPLAEVSRNDMDLYSAWHARRPGRKPGSTLSAGSRRQGLTVIGTLFRKAVRWNLLDASPATDLDKPPAPPGKLRFLSVEEWQRLPAAAPPYLRPLLRMALATGLRLKEVTTLRWSYIDRQAGLLYSHEDGKTGRSDPVPLTAEARAVLDETPRRVRSAYVFHDVSGESYDDDKARNLISQDTLASMRRAGIEGASFHTLRHTAASWMVQAAVPLAEVRDFMRHRSIVQTERYAHLQPKHLGRTVAALDAALQHSEAGRRSPGSAGDPPGGGERLLDNALVSD